jgi:hypothetical protein
MTKHYARIGGVTCDVVGGEAPILKYLALVDTPDIDSTATDHRVMAEILMDNADTVVFVTSALRYADAVPWQVLRRARSRGTEVIHVLNRVTSATHGAVVDFKSRLDAAGLGTRVLTIPEHHLAPGAQQIPGVSVRALRRALIQLADDRARSAESTYDRVIGSVLGQVDDLCASVDETIDDLSRTRSRVTADLAQRVSSLDLSKAGSGLIDPAPPPGSPRRLRKWLRDGRRLAGLSDVSAFVAAVEAMVHRDLRLWLAEDWPDDVIGQERSIQRILPVLRVAVEGWIDFVRRMATERDEQGRGLAELVLLRASVVEGFEATADLVFGSDAPTFVDRARRELIGRLEVVYAQVSAHALDLIATGIGDPDLTGLRSTSDLVKFRLVSVDA